MIKFTSVTKQFGTKKAILDISFETKKGEVIGFLGPNGAGKTTTMRLIMGLIKPTEGSISVFKLNPLQNRMKTLPKIGYLPENNPLYPEMKVSEYLNFIAEVKGQKDEKTFAKILQDLSLDEKIDNKIEALSRGFKQRVGLAAAFIGDPDILVLDEPTSGLDPLEQEKIKSLIKKIAKNKVVIFSTHILSEVEDVANRLVVINQGEIVYDDKKPRGKGSVEKLFKKLIG